MPKHKNKKKVLPLLPITYTNEKAPAERLFHWKLNEIAFDFPSEAKERLTSDFLIKEVIPVLQNRDFQKWEKVENCRENYFFDATKINHPEIANWLIQRGKQPEDIFSFYLGEEQGRLFGIRDGKFFEILWHDENHQFYLDVDIKLDCKKRKFAWDIEALSIDFPNNVTKELTPEILKEKIIPRLQSYEDKTWGEIMGKEKKEHHFVNFKESDDKQKRVLKWLKENPNYKTSDFFSFRIGAQKRLYGIIENAVFKILFYDHEHQLYPSKKKHT